MNIAIHMSIHDAYVMHDICADARPIRNMDNTHVCRAYAYVLHLHICRAYAHMSCITSASWIDTCMAIFMCIHVCRAYAQQMSCTTYARHAYVDRQCVQVRSAGKSESFVCKSGGSSIYIYMFMYVYICIYIYV